MSTMHTVLEAMAPEAREALLAHSHQVTFPAGTRIFNERRRAGPSLHPAPRLHRHPRGARPGIRRSGRTPAVQRGLGPSVAPSLGAVIADRLDPARTRLLDLFAPHGSGTPLAHAR